MTTTPLSASGDSRQSATEHLTIGWFAKRSALWLLTVAAGVGAACFIYAYADESNGAELHARAAQSAVQTPAKAP